MKKWTTLLILPIAALLAFLAPITHADDRTDPSLRMEARLDGPGSMGGQVHYAQSLGRIRIKIAVWGVRSADPYVLLDGKAVRLHMNPLQGTGYALLDSRAGTAVELQPGSKVKVMSGGFMLMAGELRQQR